MPFFVEDTSTLLFLAGISLMILVLLRRSYRRIDTRKKNSPALETVPRPIKKNAALSTLDSPEASGIQVELFDYVRDAKAELDSKMRVLQQLIANAQRQADQLQAVIERSEQMGVSAQCDTLEEINLAAALPANSVNMTDPETVFDDRLKSSLEQRDSPPKPDVQQRRIHELADEGHSSKSIAQQLGKPLGEVELMLNLRGSGP